MNIFTFRFFIFVFLIGSLCACQSKKTKHIEHLVAHPFPKYEEVVNKFFSQYKRSPKKKDQRYVFQKRPMGWYVAVQKEYKTIIDTQLFWSAHDTTYINMGYRKLNEGGRNDKEPINEILQYEFDKNVYYGYKGWDDDVINLLHEEEKLPDDFLNSLARAYSSKGARYVHPHFEYQADYKIAYDNNYDPNTFTKADIDSFSHYTSMAIQSYKRIFDQNPEYETRIGNIWIKYSNEHMYAYTELMFVNKPEAAKKFLKDGLYNDAFKAVANNLLNSCDKNAILFVGGDNDTYPLLYAQEKYNMRKDVTVVNMSLANVGRYIYYLTDLYNGNKIKLLLEKKDYLKDVNDYIMLKYNYLDPMYGEDVLRYIHEGKNKTENPGYNTVSARSMAIQTKNFIPDPINYPETIYQKIEPDIEINYMNSYMFKNQLFFLDMVITNNWERPIYISVTNDMDPFSPFRKYLSKEGLCYKVVPLGKDYNHEINLPISYSYLKNKFSYAGLSDKRQSKSVELFIDNYISEFIGIAEEFIIAKDTAKAIEIGDLVYTKFLPSRVSINLPDLADLYYVTGQKEKGYNILMKVYNQYKDQFDPAYKAYKDNYKEITSLNIEQRRVLYVFEKIKRIAGRNGDERITDLLNKHETDKMFP